MGSHSDRSAVLGRTAVCIMSALAVVTGPLFLAPAVGAVEPVRVACGDVVVSNVIVANDLSECPGNGLVVGSDDITIDLAGHTVDGVGLGSGVLISGFDGVKVTSGVVRDFDVGVTVDQGAAGSVISEIRFELNQESAVLLAGADPGNEVHTNSFDGNALAVGIVEGTTGAVVRDNHIGEGSGSGLEIVGSNDNTIAGNNFLAASDGGILLESASGNVLQQNSVTGVSDAAVTVRTESNGNRIEANTLTDSDGGVIIDTSSGNMILDNTIHGMSDVGVDLETADGNLVVGNDLRMNGEGIALFDASRNRIEGNDASQVSGTAIAIEGAAFGNAVVRNAADGTGAEGISVIVTAGPDTPGTLIDGNSASGNPGGGISVTAPGHTLRHNTANSNGGWGIYVSDGNLDGGGNLAAANGESAQCFGLLCNGVGAPPPNDQEPDTTIGETPRNPSATRTATFTFSSDEEEVPAFECSLDGAEFSACTSPLTYAGLTFGTHHFAVRAIDLARNVDDEPATYSWTIVDAPGIDCGSGLVLTADADAWIDQNSATTNKGADSSLKVRSKGPADNFRALVRFPIPTPPTGCVLDAAELRLHADGTAMGRAIVTARLDGAWDEDTVNWANHPATAGEPVSTHAGEGYRTWNVRSMVQAMMVEGSHGFLIRDAIEGDDAEHAFSTRESEGSEPQLVLRYAPAVEAPPPPTTTAEPTPTDEPTTTEPTPPTTTADPTPTDEPTTTADPTPTDEPTTTADPAPPTTDEPAPPTTDEPAPTTTTEPTPTTTAEPTPTMPPPTTTPEPTTTTEPTPTTTAEPTPTMPPPTTTPEPTTTTEPTPTTTAEPTPTMPPPTTTPEPTPTTTITADPTSTTTPEPTTTTTTEPTTTTTAEPTPTMPPPTTTPEPTPTTTITADPTSTTTPEPTTTTTTEPTTTTTAEPTPTTTTEPTPTMPPPTTTESTSATPTPSPTPIVCVSQTVVLRAVADTWIEQNSPRNNKGTDTTLKVKSQGQADNFRSLVRFALPPEPSGCVIVGATLRVFSESSTPGRSLQAWRLDGVWSESQTTWANQPVTAGVPALTTSGSGYRIWDVTESARVMAASGIHHGYLIRDEVEDASGHEQSFASRERSTPPQLVLRFAAG